MDSIEDNSQVSTFVFGPCYYNKTFAIITYGEVERNFTL